MSGIETGRTEKTVVASEAHGYALVVPSGPGKVATHALPVSGAASVGREPPAVIVVDDASVSRRHATIHGGAPPEIEDLGSTNGTKVMGRRLAPGERAPLPFGAVVELGSVVAFVQPASVTPDVEAVSVRPAEIVAATSSLGSTGARRTIAPPPGAAPGPSRRGVVVRDPTMRELYELVEVIAPSKLPILVLGETGVGKDVYAEAVHASSPRAGGAFVRLNCAALPESLLEAELFGYERGAFTGAVAAKAGLFEAGDGGTVFLDEIGEMSLVTQAKLLRVLENGEVTRIGNVKPRRVDVRFVSATNRDLEALAEIGRFRADLFFRLAGVSVTIPPLRRRPDDIPALAEAFLGRPLGADAVAHLRAYRWPGNIRELKNVIERAVLLARGGEIRPEHLAFTARLGGATADAAAPAAPATPATAPVAKSGPIRDELADVERARILETMERVGGNQSRAAKALGISRTTLIKRLEAYGYVRPRKGQDDDD